MDEALPRVPDTGRLASLLLERPLAVIDLEATGVDVAIDRVVEVAVVQVRPDGGRSMFHRLVDPGVPIPPSATAVHGIGNEDVAGCPPFAAIATDLFGALGAADLAGFGIARFDVPCWPPSSAGPGSRSRWLAGG